MKINVVIERARSDKEYLAQLRRLAAEARESGMSSPAWQKLVEEFAETPNDLVWMDNPVGYTSMMSLSTSGSPLLCDLPKPPTHGTGIAWTQFAMADLGATEDPD